MLILFESLPAYIYKCIYLKQKSAVRLISSAAYNAHSEPLLKSNNILPLYKLIEFFKLQFFHKFIQGFLSSALNNTWMKLITSMHLEIKTIFILLPPDLLNFQNYPRCTQYPKSGTLFQTQRSKSFLN